MRVLLYTPPGDIEDARRLERKIGDIAPAETIESFKSLQSLALRLQEVLYEPAISILFAENREELRRIKEMGGLLSDLQVFLVIPDQEPETIAIAHLLRPRFLTTRDSDYADLGAVFSKKLSSDESRHR
jgi:hypothetical protein